MSRNCSTPETSWSPIWRSRCQPVGGPTRSVPPPPSTSCDATPRKGARPPRTGAWPGAAVAGPPPACAPQITHGPTDTNRPAIAAHAATRRVDVAEHEHSQGPGAGAYRKAGSHSPAQGYTRQRTHTRRASRPRRGWGPRDWPRSLACGISLVACAFAICSLWCPGAKAHGSRAAVHRFRRLLCCLRRTGRSPVAGPAPGGHPVRRGRPQLRDCRQHDGQTCGGHDRHGHRGRPPAVPGDRAGPPAARSLYAHPPPYRRGGSRRAPH